MAGRRRRQSRRGDGAEPLAIVADGGGGPGVPLLPDRHLPAAGAAGLEQLRDAGRIRRVGTGLPAEADRSEADSSASTGPSSWGPTSWQAVRGLALAAVVVLGAELIVLPFHLLSLAADGSPAAAASAARLTGDYGGILLLRVASLCVAAAALLGVLARDRLLASTRLTRPLTSAAFCLVLVSELCGRFLFYAMQVRVGI